MSELAATARRVNEGSSAAARYLRPRPLSRKLGAALSGIVATTLATSMVLYLFLLPFTLINGPRVDEAIEALVAFGRQLDDGAVEFQGIVLGVLGALFIGRIVAPVDDLKHQVAIDAGSAFAGHVLAAFVVSTAVLAGVGAALDDDNAAHMWFFSLLAVVAYALAWGIDAGITIARKRQRRRARAALIGTSWRVHRRAARLRQARGARSRPRVRLLVAVSSTVIVAAAAAGYLVLATAPGGVSGSFVIVVLGSALVLASWGTVWASLLILSRWDPEQIFFEPLMAR